jgi:uncharacterized protein (DUF1697 family)
MTVYACLLRGINVGGRAKVAMSDLRQVFVALGHDDATTFIQSGNVIFTAAGRPAVLTAAIEARIARDLRLPIRVVLRTGGELEKIVSSNSFAARGAVPSALHVTFLAAPPAPARVRSIPADVGSPDEFRVSGREIYLHCPSGIGRAKISNTFWEKQLDVAATTRNWNTVTKLLELTHGR